MPNETRLPPVRHGAAARQTLRSIACVFLLLGMLAPARAAGTLDALVAAYPDALARHDGERLYFRDGSSLPVSDGRPDKPFDAMLRGGSIADQLKMDYPKGKPDNPPGVDADPGRIRNAAFFAKMYGDCRKGEVAGRLVSVAWLPKGSGTSVRFTSVNGAAARLQEVVNELDQLPAALKLYLHPSAGTYNCRPVADTGQLSMHSYGAAIDINVKYSDYWFWHRQAGTIPYVNRIPYEIAAIFEKHGFIWGGKWYHYDTMHFEYRPELLR